METFAFVTAVAVGVWALWFIFGTRTIEETTDPSHQDSVLLTSIVQQLSGIREHDDIILNRILALGVDGIPILLNEIIRRRQDDESRHANVISSIENVIYHFGIAGIPSLCQQLARRHAGPGVSPHIFRIMDRLGPVGATAALQYGLSHNCHGTDLHRHTHNIEFTGLMTVLSNTEDKNLLNALDVCASRLYDHPETLDGLWSKSAPHRKILILRWLQGWLPLCHRDVLIKGLSDITRDVRIQAARRDLDGRLVCTRLRHVEGDVPRVAHCLSGALARDIKQIRTEH